MIDHLFPYYERELRYINLLTQEFARRHPNAAQRLGIEATGSSDPYVQRLLETFALLAGRTHAKIEDEYPELTDGLLQFLYPHFLAPIPSMALLQFESDPARVQMPGGFLIDRGSLIEAATEPIACKFRTAYPVRLWPIRLNRASFRAPPFPSGLQPPAGAVAAVRLELECVGELTFAQLQIDALRLFLHGDPQLVPDLYEIILNDAIQVVFVPDKAATSNTPVALNPENSLHSVGFGPAEGLLPYSENARMGYRLFTEFFTFPAKFQFIDLTGWQTLSNRAGLGRKCDVYIFCKNTSKALEQGVNTETFRLGCTPVVNLFDKTVEPIPLRPRQAAYRIVADRMSPKSFEVYAVTKVTSTDPTANRTTDYPPFYALEHAQGTRGGRIFWYTTRQRSLEEDDTGTEVDLALVNLHFETRWPSDEMLDVQILCMNRDLPSRIAAARPAIGWTLDVPAPCEVKCLRFPTPPLRPAARTGGAWELISHLSPNPLSLQEGIPGRAALRDILKLYDFSDPAAGQKHLKDQALQIVEGLLDVNYRRVLGRVPSDPKRGLCRGVEVTVELDPTKFPLRGAFLFSAVLNRFLSLYATSNSFTELIVNTPLAPLRKWPARTGEIPLL
ncbi:MAG: type VI secretion system baseplate subunit TssF [Planctomycetes bacterium]|nr:type VI secretion system baseplate subunit TssF [Planctomycetota bacterium]